MHTEPYSEEEFIKLYRRAVGLAVEVHGSQTWSIYPYFVHLFLVWKEINKRFSTHNKRLDQVLQITAWLHDIIEDTDVKLSDLIEYFDGDIVHIIDCVTDEPGENRKERKRKTYPKIVSRSESVILKVADRLVNVRGCNDPMKHSHLDMYRKEHSEFREAMLSGDPHYYISGMMAEIDKLLGWKRE